VTLALLAIATLAALGALALAAAVPGRAAAAVRAGLADRLDALERGQERQERATREELGALRAEEAAAAAQLRDELRATLKDVADSTHQHTAELLGLQKGQLDGFGAQIGKLTESNEARLDALRRTVDEKLAALQQESAQRLEEMRRTVDEKLQGTLEQRLGEAFRMVGERLEAVQRGLGEMQTLASGVGDLKKVLANVKVRGTWGEIQLGSLLAQVLAPEQYAVNVATRPHASERVEFAVRLPGSERGQEVLLPIDSKFPLEDYQRLVEAAERADAAGVEESARQLEARIKACAQDIRDKYLNPPATTDFGILFLPTEGLYAEVARRSGLIELLQREQRVVVAGPTTLAALLNSLQMGFRTLAIQKRSGEVWQVLGAVKAEFGKFGEVLAAVEKKLVEASNKLGAVGTRSRAIERRLQTVQELPAGEAQALLLQDAALNPADEA
jgi:DNA recombination protein RmuC